MKAQSGSSNAFHALYDALSMMEHYLKSDLFLYVTYGMVQSNPEDGLRLFDDMVKNGKVGGVDER